MCVFRDVIFCSFYIFSVAFMAPCSFSSLIDHESGCGQSSYYYSNLRFFGWMPKIYLQSSWSQRQEGVYWRQNWQWSVINPRARMLVKLSIIWCCWLNIWSEVYRLYIDGIQTAVIFLIRLRWPKNKNDSKRLRGRLPPTRTVDILFRRLV